MLLGAIDQTQQSVGAKGGVEFRIAEHLEQRLLAFRIRMLRERAYGPDAPALVENLIALGTHLNDRSTFSDAEPLFRRAVAISEKFFGPDNPNLAAALEGYGICLYSQGRYADGKLLYERALAIREAVFGAAATAPAWSSAATLMAQAIRRAEITADPRRLRRGPNLW